MCQRCDDMEDEDLENSSDGFVVQQADATWAGTVPARGYRLTSARMGYDFGNDVLSAVDLVLTDNAGQRGIVTVRVEFKDTLGVFPGQVYQHTTDAVRSDGRVDLFEVESIEGGMAYSTAGHYEELDALTDPERYLVVHGA